MDQKFWIVVVSKDHTMRGVEGYYIQACHGKASPLKRMQKGDWIVVYSPKVKMDESTKSQCFTAIGQVKDNMIYQYKISENFIPYRRNIDFMPSKELSILGLIDQLDFILNKKSWGYPFRYGVLEIGKKDFELISTKMTINEKQ
jgi:EVE domain